MPDSAQKFYLSRHLLLALVIATAFVVWAQGPRILDPFQVEEDFRNLYWVRLFEDKHYFPADHYYVEHEFIHQGKYERSKSSARTNI